MNERLPYEEQLQQQWHDLPLPDENKAWADMKRRLDDDDDDGVVVAWWRRGCGLWGLLLVALLALGWLWLKPHRWLSSRPGSNVPVVTQNDTISGKELGPVVVNGDTISLNTPRTIRQQSNDNTTEPASTNNNTSTDPTATNPGTTGQPTAGNGKNNISNETTKPSAATDSETEITITPGGKTTRRKTTSSNNPSTRKTGTRPRVAKNNTNNNVAVITPGTGKPVSSVNDKPTSSTDKNSRDSVPTATIDNKKSGTDSLLVKQQPDSVKQQPPATTVKKDSTGSKPADKAKKEMEKKTFFFSGGIALQQQIPIAGQTASPYNAVGRKGSLRDYIPSVYLRFNKKDSWFFQGEFRYGAPQYTKKLEYDRVSVLDTAGPRDFTVTTSQRVLKTYYHQLPITFQHYILPGWSLGGGVVWNKFNGAVTEEQVNQKHNITQNDTVLSYNVKLDKRDSSGVFSKSYLQAVIETQYQWKRFSLGARYAFGLQPYIRFTLPGALPREEKNSSLQIFLRYQLWKSKER